MSMMNWGNLIKTIRPDGQELSHLTYGSGHVYGVALNQHDLVAFQRDDLHRETTRLLANGLVQSSAYNDVGLLSQQSIQAEQETPDFIRHQASRQYQYDQNYLLTQVEDSRLGKLSYQYDAIGRLTQSNSAQGTERFNFDPAGNLIDVNSAHTTALKNNLIREYQGKHYRYDAQGNVIESQKAGEVLKLKWDNLNRLIASERNGQVTEYGYDVFGRRLYKKSHHNNQNQLTLFGWDGDLMIWEPKQGSHPQDHYTKHYVYEANSFVPLLQAGYRNFIQLKETPNYKELFKVQPYAMRKDPLWRDDTRNKRKELEKVAFYHCDQVGTPQTLSNERGECIWEITQNTWGEALEIKAIDDLLEQSHIRFQGQYYDEETGLHYNRYRYYEPYSARYMSKDPIGLFGGLNSSSYVQNPNQLVDLLGLNSSDSRKSNQLLSQSEKNALNSVAENSKNNITKTAVYGLMAAEKTRVAGKAIYSLLAGQTIKSIDTGKKVTNAINNNAQNNMTNVLSGGLSAGMAIKEGASVLQQTAQNQIIGNTVPVMLKSHEVVERVKFSASLTITLCQSAGGCRRPDYITCSGSAAMTGGSVSVNLYNGSIFAGSGADVGMLGKNIYQGITNSAQGINKISQVLGGHCSLGYIFNKKGPASAVTDVFLSGGATGGGLTLRNMRFGVSNPINKDWLDIKSPKAIEVGVSPDKLNFDVGISISTPVIKGNSDE